MSDPTSRDWLGSKRMVLCGYCNIESRFDNLKRHGKDLPVKYSVIKVKESVKNLFLFKASDNNNQEKKDLEVEIEDDNKLEDDDNADRGGECINKLLCENASTGAIVGG